MSRLALVPLLAALAGAGCHADYRIARLEMKIAEDRQLGHVAKAEEDERRLLTLAREHYSEGSRVDIRVRSELARAHARWGNTKRAFAMADQLLADLERLHGPGSALTTPALLTKAEIHLQLREWKAAENLADRIVGICKAVPQPPPTQNQANCDWHERMRPREIYFLAGAFEKWADAFHVVAAKAASDDDKGLHLHMESTLGEHYADYGLYAEALWYLESCVDHSRPAYERRRAAEQPLWSSASGDVEIVVPDYAHDFHSQSPPCLETVIDVKTRLGDAATVRRLSDWRRELWARGPDREKHFRNYIKISDGAWGPFLTARYANDLAWYYLGKGRLDDAIRAFEDAGARIDQAVVDGFTFQDDYPSYTHTDILLGLGAAYEDSGRFLEAEAAYRRASEIAAEHFHPKRDRRLTAMTGAARCLALAGKQDEARSAWQAYLDVAAKVRGKDHADYAVGLAGLAELRSASGREREAADLRRRAESIRNAVLERQRSFGPFVLPTSLLSPPTPAN
ncbi:MAG: tetratricopeptide repeat protein [Candidatus Binatia bacterium]